MTKEEIQAKIASIGESEEEKLQRYLNGATEANKFYNDIVKKYNFLKEKGINVAIYDDFLKKLSYLIDDKRTEAAKQDAINGCSNYLINNLNTFYGYMKLSDVDKLLNSINDEYYSYLYDSTFPNANIEKHTINMTSRYENFNNMYQYLIKHKANVDLYKTVMNDLRGLLDFLSLKSFLSKPVKRIKNILYNAYLLMDVDQIHSVDLKSLEQEYQKYKNNENIPLEERESIISEYVITIKELKTLNRKLEKILIHSTSIQTLKKLAREFEEEYTHDLVDECDYGQMIHATMVVNKLIHNIYQKDVTNINVINTKNIVNATYMNEREHGDGHDIFDQYHTMSELYFNRLVMFDMICKMFPSKAWKSKLHDDGTMFDNYFIVGIDTPNGQFTYHYHMKFWDIFTCKEIPKAPKYDGHQPKDISRLYSLLIEKGE